ncbi:hypothetical protein [Wolbachia endosymbiont (group A) of Bibio marci]|uniref:hypothetical protein n=1 Tax=Wolbachia endosymbiont (group A) of Bibio marci TaxID=2953987 RepID=UPI00222EFF55|nr:hypothetical protein [Wolbachia endosymbiont (group A) of Bibio marci]
MSTSNLKISIAALSLCVSAVAIYIHLPYVIAAVSGSGAIEAVPLAIFAVSTIVALVSVICLIRLAVSRAGDKKKIDLIKKDSGSQIKVDSGTGSQDKSSVPTSPSQPPQTCDTASSQVPQEKSVKQGSGSHIEVDSGTSSQDKSSVPTSPSQSPQTCNSIPPPPPLPVAQVDPPEVSKERKENKTNATASAFDTVDEEFKAKGGTFGLRKVFTVQQDPVKELDAVQSNKGTDKKETQEEYNARVDKLQEERKKRNENDSGLNKTLEKRLVVMAPSDNESEYSSWASDEDGHDQTEPEQEKEEQTKHTNSPSSKEEGSGGLDSGIGSRAASPSYSEQKTE